MVGAGRVSGLIFQALRYFGAKRISDRVLRKIAEPMTPEDKKCYTETVSLHLYGSRRLLKKLSPRNLERMERWMISFVPRVGFVLAGLTMK